MILKIRDIHAYARAIVVDDGAGGSEAGTLIFARLITGNMEARAIAYFAAQKGGFVEAHPHAGWARIQAGATRVRIEATSVQGVAQKIVTLYLPAFSGRRYFIARQESGEGQFRRFLHACSPYPIPRSLLGPGRWGRQLATYDSQGLTALAFTESDIRELLKEASHAP